MNTGKDDNDPEDPHIAGRVEDDKGRTGKEDTLRDKLMLPFRFLGGLVQMLFWPIQFLTSFGKS